MGTPRGSRTKLDAIIKAATALIQDPSDLAYPARDGYGSCRREDREAPLWTESGLYGRVGKEAARTLLARRRMLKEALIAWGVDIKEDDDE